MGGLGGLKSTVLEREAFFLNNVHAARMGATYSPFLTSQVCSFRGISFSRFLLFHSFSSAKHPNCAVSEEQAFRTAGIEGFLAPRNAPHPSHKRFFQKKCARHPKKKLTSSLWIALGGSWGGLGAPFGESGAVLGPSWPLLSSSSQFWLALGRLLAALGSLLVALGPLLAALGPLLGHSWAALGRSWVTLGPLWGALGLLLRVSWPLLGRS